MNDTESECKNCHRPLLSAAKFCAECGQSAKNLHKPFMAVIKDTLHETLDIDGRLMLTLKTLLFKPGRLSLDYNIGKRVKYTPPLRMYLVISILFFLIMAQVDLTIEMSEIYQRNTKASSDAVYALLPKLMFILLPLFALFMKILYRNTYYISNLVFAVHFHCFAYLILVLMLPLEAIVKNHPIFVFLQIPLLCYLIYYLVKAMKLNYQQNWFKTIGKMLVLTIVYSALIMMSIESIQNGFSKGLLAPSF